MAESSTVTREDDREAIATELRRRGDEALRLAEYEAKKTTRGFLKGASAAFHEAAKLVTAAPSRAEPPAAGIGPARCEVCDWPLVDSREKGCVAGDCSYRPEDPAEQRRIADRRTALAQREAARG